MSGTESGNGAAVTHGAVERCLDRVTDPELDQSIVELDYIECIDIVDDRVLVEFVLPTAWCSPAFAWMMATDARDEIRGLSGVTDTTEVTVRLHDHMHAAEINEGVNADREFGAVFEDAEDDVADVRATLDAKARLARQHSAVEALLEAGVTTDQAASLTRADLALDREAEEAAVQLRDGTLVVSVPFEPLAEYLEKATTVGIATSPDDPLFATPDGEAIAPENFKLVHRRARLARTNMSGQAGVCEQLHESRNGGRTDDTIAD